MTRGASLKQARAAKQKALQRLIGVAEINGIGIARRGTGYTVKVNLAKPAPKGTAIPSEIDGVPVVAEVVGKIRPL